MTTCLPSRLAFERALLAQGVARIAGIDEAGRGPLAGPVAAAVVVLPEAWLTHGLPPELEDLDDSKRLSPPQREYFRERLLACDDLQHGIAYVEAEEIDRINILRATHTAMLRALAQLDPQPHHLLVDGCLVSTLPGPQTPIVRGDALSYSIAAASVLAKVARDRLMEAYHREWPAYGFIEHKGYATPRHLAALAQHGPCPIHRRSFAPVRSQQLELLYE